MKTIDTALNLRLKSEFTPIKRKIEKLIKRYKLQDANIVCWVPHEVSSIVQLGWEDGLLEDMKNFLNEVIPSKKWIKHDEPGTPFRKNFYQHLRTKIIGDVSKTLIVKDGKLYIGKFQDLYFYSPVWKSIPRQKIFCRIVKLK